MKFRDKVKPIQIRVKSGDGVHSTLKSLKQDFYAKDVLDALEGGVLSKWLELKDENQLYAKVSNFKDSYGTKLTVESYLELLKIFFEPELKGKSIMTLEDVVNVIYIDSNFKKTCSYLQDFLYKGNRGKLSVKNTTSTSQQPSSSVNVGFNNSQVDSGNTPSSSQSVPISGNSGYGTPQNPIIEKPKCNW